ncbi:endophilin-B1-like [Rhopilema esculentum]|uniref:endophilin-B1-like n=1 Tax=Rhopilema esculentum TaxID=499914 RepID=UPI0031DB161D
MAANNDMQVTSAELKDNFMRFANSALRTSKTAFNRARQLTEERFGNAERTELDAQFEYLCKRADTTKQATEKLVANTAALLKPNPGARLEDFVFEKLDKQSPLRPTNSFLLGQSMSSAGREIGADSDYGNSLNKTGTALKKIGNAEKDFMQKTISHYIHPLKTFLDNDMKTLAKERRALDIARIDLDAARNKVKRAQSPIRLREAEGQFRVAQADFDRQYEITKLLLDGINSTHSNHLRNLGSFVEALGMYHAQCQQYVSELQKDLQGLTRSAPPSAPPQRPEAPPLKQPEMQQPTQRKARVLYDYDAADLTELSLLADEVVVVYSVEGMDSDWMMAERGSQKGKVPLTYLELM